jgi:hypothetical protein
LQSATNNPYKGRAVDTNNMKLILVETKIVKDGTIENSNAPYTIPTEKGFDSSVKTLLHVIHKLATKFKLDDSKGMEVRYSVEINGVETGVVISSRLGLVIKEKPSEAYLKEAGLKKISLKDFQLDYTSFNILFPAMVDVFKYHLGAYIDESTRAESYKYTANNYFGRNLKEGKSDIVSWAQQTKSAAEKTLYVVRERMESAAVENTDDFLEDRRASARLAIAFKSEQRKLIAAAKK